VWGSFGSVVSPTEFVLHALAACLTAGLATVAAARRVTLTEVRCPLGGLRQRHQRGARHHRGGHRLTFTSGMEA
jgi:uncharacterized OsmC-like protein